MEESLWPHKIAQLKDKKEQKHKRKKKKEKRKKKREKGFCIKYKLYNGK
jgi:hypothetical protein